MKTKIVGWVGLSMLLALAFVPSATALATANTPSDDGEELPCIGSVCYCVNTAATCGPYGEAWVWVQAEALGIRVCVTSHTNHILC